MYMKAIQVSFDENLLRQLDSDEEVRRDGRSAVLRRAAAAYLRRKRSSQIADAYRRGYGDSGGLGSEFEGWEKEGKWPEK
jgi:metal-responsive CopG/Arc/MetJ family transcriptional regulator